MTIIGSIVISLIYYSKYSFLLTSLLLFFISPSTLIVKFYITQHSVKENFLEYKKLNYLNAFLRLIMIPFSIFFGVSGWIGAQTVASLTTIKLSKEKLFLNINKFKISLIGLHIKEGLSLLAMFFLWNQLLNSGRLYATIYFDDLAIAQYGITNAGYALLSGLFISIFLPVTVSVLKIIQDDTKGAINQLFDTIFKTTLIFFCIVILAIEFAPYLYKAVFPKYDIDFDILKYQLLSLASFPLIATLGNIFVGLKQPIKLLIIYGISFFVSYLVIYFLHDDLGIVSASVAQFIGISFMGLSLLVSVIFFFRKEIDSKLVKIIGIIGIVYMPYIIYFTIRIYI